ncbi:hypothetical protein GGS20DRAFT_569146 [Poronia punctata]|nr:hypothetical protein GGS20DRAFT_569146 [Poronia punctata]
MPSTATLLTSLIASASCAFATPSVTAVKLPSDDCSSWPGYDASTGIAGPWLVYAVNADNTTIEGFGDTSIYSVKFNPATDHKPTIRWGYLAFPTTNDKAKQPLRCQNGQLQAYVPTDLTDAGAPTAIEWSALKISVYPYDASLLWKVEGQSPSIFEHYVDGVKQDGVFLGGYDDSTTWGLKFQAKDNFNSFEDFFYTRLLGPNSADPTTGAPLKQGETTAFIKIAAL